MAHIGEVPTPTTRDALLARRDTLRRERGAALLDGRQFQAGPLIATENALGAWDDAEQEEARRSAAQAAQAAAEHRARIAGAVALLDAARLESLAQAEIAALQMVNAMAEVQRLSAEIVATSGQVGPAPIGLMPTEVDRRLSHYLSAALGPVRSGPCFLGDLEWNQPAAPITDWAASDRAATAADLSSILRQRNMP